MVDSGLGVTVFALTPKVKKVPEISKQSKIAKNRFISSYSNQYTFAPEGGGGGVPSTAS